MDRLFGKLKMSWLAVILFAVAAGIYTGLIMLVPGLVDTSFQDIGISYEWWVVFAVIIVVNCDKAWEAMLKCFVFFLISQPLVYAVEVLFGQLSFDMGWYYYRRIWLPMTFLTLPGGFMAYFCKKQNLIGSVILGLGNTNLSVMAVYFFTTFKSDFPHHVLSLVFCLAAVLILSLMIQKKPLFSLISILLPVPITYLLFTLR